MRIRSGPAIALGLTLASLGCGERAGDDGTAGGDTPVADLVPPEDRSDFEKWDSTATTAPPIEDATSRVIRLSTARGTWRLVLPSSAFAAMREVAPRFVAWTPAHYWRAITDLGFFDFSGAQAMFAVVGDFNGDGLADAIVDGIADGDALRLALLSDRGSYVAGELGRRPLGDGEALSTEATEFLTVASPGRYAEPSYLGSRSVDLTTDAFIVAYFEKAATLYYLRSGQWQELPLSD
jgi:hypothetical protein